MLVNILLLINLYIKCKTQGILPWPFLEDTDADGIPDFYTNATGHEIRIDNCLPGDFPFHTGENPNQADYDNDGIGDVCDNCPFVYNPDQLDSNNDTYGDACTDDNGVPYALYYIDSDGDGIPDDLDNCVNVSNPAQYDNDNDTIGNACDNDIDGDGIPNDSDTDDDEYWPDYNDSQPDATDNCPEVFNYYQPGNYPYAYDSGEQAFFGDWDDDGVGDYFYDPEYGIVTGCDNCYNDYNPDQNDTDGDGWGDVCDNCPNISNPRQINTDSDGIGDECDNCPFIQNSDQNDTDGDGWGDVCDNCPYTYNPDQLDSNGDGIGDACSCYVCAIDITLSSIGNITIEPCITETNGPTTEPTEKPYSNSYDKKQSKQKKYWKHREKTKTDSSGSNRRRILLGNSDSSDSFNPDTDDSWLINKKCIPNCKQWGLQRGLICGCYSNCTSSTVNNTCYEGEIHGYCGIGSCCCGECIGEECNYYDSSDDGAMYKHKGRYLLGSDRCSSSDSSSQDGYYSYKEYYNDKCDIDNDNGNSMKGMMSSSDDRRHVRRRQLLGASFGSMRYLLGSKYSDSSSMDGDDSGGSDGDVDEFLIETCIRYEISWPGNGSIPDCAEIEGIFLPLCENNFTDFNSSNLNASDITELITDETFALGTNVLTAEGAIINGTLGILITLINYNVSYFEICVGNVTVNAQNIDTLNITTIDTSQGYIFGVINFNNSNGTLVNDTFTCNIDGLPCFNFFFEEECPPTTTDDSIYRSCDCDDGMSSIELLYEGEGSANIRATRKTKDRGDVYNEFTDVPPGDIITFTAGEYNTFRKKTGITVFDENNNVLCMGKIYKCSISNIGEEINGCEYLTLLSWMNGDGGTCDEIAVNSDSTDGANALINNKYTMDNPFVVFEQMDPYIRYSLIGIICTFIGCIVFIGGYVCLGGRKKDIENDNRNDIENNDNNNESSMDDLSKEIEMQQKGRTQTNVSDGNNNETIAIISNDD